MVYALDGGQIAFIITFIVVGGGIIAANIWIKKEGKK